MNAYVTKKEGIRIFKADREEQRGKGFVRGRRHQKSGEAPGDVISAFIREFRGEIVSGDKMNLYSF